MVKGGCSKTMSCLLDAVVPLVMVVEWYFRDVLQETIRTTVWH